MPDLPSTWEQWGGLAQVLATLVALGGLIAVIYQLRATRQVLTVDTILHLEELLPEYFDVHVKLRPGGCWVNMKWDNLTTSEMARIETYMGFLERINVLLEHKALSVEQARHFYRYRVQNITSNRAIFCEKLIKRRDGWAEFIALAKTLGAQPPPGLSWSLKECPEQ
jgi:hypothetical protein